MSILGRLLQSIESAGQSAASGIGGALSKGFDEASLLASGALDEAYDPMQDDLGLSQPDRKSVGGVSTGQYQDKAAGSAYEDQNYERLMNILGAPIRAVDRASNEYLGDTLTPFNESEQFAERPTSQPTSKNSQSDPVETIANAVVDGQEAKATKQEKKMQIPEVKALMELKARSKADPENVFVGRGNNTLIRAQNPAGDNQIGETYSKSLRPLIEQQQINTLGKLGIAPDRAEMMIDSASQNQAQAVIANIVQQQSITKEQKINEALGTYETAVAKATNPGQVLQSLVVRLRNLGLGEEQIRGLLSGIKNTQGNQ